MIYVLEFLFSDNTTQQIAINRNEKITCDSVSKKLNCEFIDGLLECDSNETVKNINFYKNIPIPFTSEEFMDFLNNKMSVDLMRVYWFFGDTENIINIIKNSNVSTIIILLHKHSFLFDILKTNPSLCPSMCHGIFKNVNNYFSIFMKNIDVNDKMYKKHEELGYFCNKELLAGFMLKHEKATSKYQFVLETGIMATLMSSICVSSMFTIIKSENNVLSRVCAVLNSNEYGIGGNITREYSIHYDSGDLLLTFSYDFSGYNVKIKHVPEKAISFLTSNAAINSYGHYHLCVEGTEKCVKIANSSEIIFGNMVEESQATQMTCETGNKIIVIGIN